METICTAGSRRFSLTGPGRQSNKEHDKALPPPGDEELLRKWLIKEVVKAHFSPTASSPSLTCHFDPRGW